MSIQCNLCSILDKNVQCNLIMRETIRKMQNLAYSRWQLVKVFKNHCHRKRRDSVLTLKRLRRQQPNAMCSSWLDPGWGENGIKICLEQLRKFGYGMNIGIDRGNNWIFLGIMVVWLGESNVFIFRSCILKVFRAAFSWCLQFTLNSLSEKKYVDVEIHTQM